DRARSLRRRLLLRAQRRATQARPVEHPTTRRTAVTRRERPRRLIASLASLALCALLATSLGACGSKQDTLAASPAKPFKLMLDFFPNADHAAIYSAIANGYFRAVGLDVQPQAPADPSEPLKLLAAGKVDMAISYEPEVLLARDSGLGVVSVGALVQRPL